jgi:hypothetical protein
MAIITYPLNSKTYQASDSELYACTRTSGVFAGTGHFDVTITGDRTIQIGTGIAWIKNDVFTGKVVGVTDEITLTIDAADSVLDRIDRVVLRFDRAANETSLVVKKGTPGSSPSASDRSATSALYELVLYDVAVGHGTTSITAADITDQRLDESLCGLMRDGVTGLPTATLQAQVTALLATLQTALEAALAGGIPNHVFTHAAGGDDPLVKNATAALPTSGYSGTGPYTIALSVPGAKADTNQAIIAGPAPGYGEAYAAVGAYPSGQDADTVTFTVASVPSSAINVNILLIG